MDNNNFETMNDKDAINLSPKGKATRFEEKNGVKKITIKYKDGSGLVAILDKDMRIDLSKVREATHNELTGFNDWKPKNK